MKFLKEMAKHYEIVIFTAGLKDYADWILNQIDQRNYLIQHRLYRESCTYSKGVNLKDLNGLGRNLAKTIIIDNLAQNFYLQPDNGILIGTWLSDPKDTELSKLEPILKSVVN